MWKRRTRANAMMAVVDLILAIALVRFDSNLGEIFLFSAGLFAFAAAMHFLQEEKDSMDQKTRVRNLKP